VYDELYSKHWTSRSRLQYMYVFSIRIVFVDIHAFSSVFMARCYIPACGLETTCFFVSGTHRKVFTKRAGLLGEFNVTVIVQYGISYCNWP
jgi:hypothetical protein